MIWVVEVIDDVSAPVPIDLAGNEGRAMKKLVEAAQKHGIDYVQLRQYEPTDLTVRLTTARNFVETAKLPKEEVPYVGSDEPQPAVY